jgi:hypothetical protein
MTKVGGLFGNADAFEDRLDDMTAAGANHHWALGIDAHRLPLTEIEALGAIRSGTTNGSLRRAS